MAVKIYDVCRWLGCFTKLKLVYFLFALGDNLLSVLLCGIVVDFALLAKL